MKRKSVPFVSVIFKRRRIVITRAFVILGILLPGVLHGQEVTAEAQAKDVDDAGSVVYLHETFEDYEVDAVPTVSQLQRVDKVTVVEGNGKVGTGKVANFNDADKEAGGAMEYNLGESALGAMYIEFDALNGAPTKEDKSSTGIFGVGPWENGKSLLLNAKAKRAFGFEMYQQKYLKLRVGSKVVGQLKYEATAPFNVKIWANDHDENTLSYTRPDTGANETLNADSVVVYVNNALIDKLDASGSPMHPDVTEGNAVIGRAGFSSSSTKEGNFLIDNLHFEDPSPEAKKESTGEKKTDSPAKTKSSANAEGTPKSLPGAEKMSYREGENAMDLFVFKPDGWKAGDKRSAFVFFFGGGWTTGTPQNSASVAAWAAKNGMVGIAPDYRTKNRFGTSPLASVDDSRAAFDWVVKHAVELGIDPARVAVGGSSAGGHVALWTAIEKTPPGSDDATAPKSKPAAIVLTSAVSDTSPEIGYTAKRFGDDATALSPVHQLDARMPPMLIVHAANDDLVHYSTAVALHSKLNSTGNKCELVTVPVGGHGFSSEYPAWNSRVRNKMEELMKREGLLPAVR